MKELVLKVFAVMFLLVALLHLLRLIFRVPVTVGCCSIPVYVSVFGFFVALILGLWALKAAKK